MIQIDAAHAKGMDTDIPFRLCVSLEVPRVRAPWFSIPKKEGKTVQEQFLVELEKNDIAYVLINHQVWFFWANHWCSYDHYLDGDDIKINLLVYRTIST